MNPPPEPRPLPEGEESIFRINANYNPDENWEPDWIETTQAGYMTEWGVDQDIWDDMMKAGAIEALPAPSVLTEKACSKCGEMFTPSRPSVKLCAGCVIAVIMAPDEDPDALPESPTPGKTEGVTPRTDTEKYASELQYLCDVVMGQQNTATRFPDVLTKAREDYAELAQLRAENERRKWLPMASASEDCREYFIIWTEAPGWQKKSGFMGSHSIVQGRPRDHWPENVKGWQPLPEPPDVEGGQGQ